MQTESAMISVRDAAANESEFDAMSAAVYELIIEIKAKSAEIVHEYGFKSLTSSPQRRRQSHASDTDDIDATTVLQSCR